MSCKLHLIDSDENFDILPADSNKIGDLALFIDREFIASWGVHEIPPNHILIEAMLDHAFKRGKEARSAEILKLLGGK